VKTGTWNDFLNRRLLVDAPAAVTIGVFDGVHRGHQVLIHALNEQPGLTSVAVSFLENPARILRPDLYPGDIDSIRIKLKKLRNAGIQYVVLAEFTDEFQRLSGENFLCLLGESMELRMISVGADFHCGRNMETNAEDIRRVLEPHGIRVDIHAPLVDNVTHNPVSSTVIRQAVKAGDFGTASRLLGTDYILDCTDLETEIHKNSMCVSCKGMRQILPAPGFYDVTVSDEHSESPVTARVTGENITVYGKTADQFGNYIYFRQRREDI
jgi:riboflavin kinase / FMN adenylyltransferase